MTFNLRKEQTMKAVKTSIYAVLLSSGALIATSASAQSYGYGGIGFGQGHASIPSFLFSDTSVAPPITGSFTEGKTRDTAYKLYLGYQYTPNWGIELGYNDLGKKYSSHIVATDGITTATGDATFKLDNWYLAATGTLPLSNGFSLLGKLGAVRSTVKGGTITLTNGITTASASLGGDSHHSSALLGVGVEYTFSKQLAARLEYEDYGKSSEDIGGGVGAIKTNAWYLSLKGSF
jgi:OOP family OmpA-OmpF porin